MSYNKFELNEADWNETIALIKAWKGGLLDTPLKTKNYTFTVCSVPRISDDRVTVITKGGNLVKFVKVSKKQDTVKETTKPALPTLSDEYFGWKLIENEQENSPMQDKFFPVLFDLIKETCRPPYWDTENAVLVYWYQQLAHSRTRSGINCLTQESAIPKEFRFDCQSWLNQIVGKAYATISN